MKRTPYTEEDFARIYEEAYQECIAMGDDRRVARAIAKAKETDARREQQYRNRTVRTAAEPEPQSRTVRRFVIRRSYDDAAHA